MNNSFDDINIQELLPPKPPFVIVDKLLACDESVSVTELEVRDDNVFFDKGHLLSAGIVENMAQTCAAGIGYRNASSGGGIKVGVIGALSNLDIKRLPRKGERITTTATFVEAIFQMSLFDVVVRCGEEELATVTMKTALTDMDAKP